MLLRLMRNSKLIMLFFILLCVSAPLPPEATASPPEETLSFATPLSPPPDAPAPAPPPPEVTLFCSAPPPEETLSFATPPTESKRVYSYPSWRDMPRNTKLKIYWSCALLLCSNLFNCYVLILTFLTSVGELYVV